ncbi:hypothetical protein [Sutterella sp.]|uniref:hypothetical protein n=1 Tax=Sutterella sp. TaxID=1981025 RepID=UPI0026E08813|nr:hypothetical protein [Sutterella sp.]MDO5531212.1 hypothetical protein [Sutterella sp.]
MTEACTTPDQNTTEAELGALLAAAAQKLPRKASALSDITFRDALAVVAELDLLGNCDKCKIAALRFVLGCDKDCCEVVAALPALWQKACELLTAESPAAAEAAFEAALESAPEGSRELLPVFLKVMLPTLAARNGAAREQFVLNAMRLARVVADDVATGDSGWKLPKVVRELIHRFGLERQLAPEGFHIWRIRIREGLSEAETAEVLEIVRRIAVKTDLDYYIDHHELFIRSTQGSLERYCAALAARFPGLLRIKRLPGNASVAWIHEDDAVGEGLSSLHGQLMGSNRADPFTELFRWDGDTSETAAEFAALRQFGKRFSKL